MIELGAGFDYDLTAEENVYLNGAILGYTHAEMEKHYEDIGKKVTIIQLSTPLKQLIKNHFNWDGKDEKGRGRTPDTCNEVDVVLMHGLTPVFVSCKNGNVDENELYKLHTVAHWFGGPYAKKMLVATDLNWAENRALIYRAQDMGIRIVTDGADRSSSQWAEAFRSAVEQG